MRTIETVAVIQQNHTITLTLPADIPAGPCRVVLVVNPETEVAPGQSTSGPPKRLTEGWPVHDVGPWPEGFTASREQIYDDTGR
jgi:hypothetical protein